MHSVRHFCPTATKIESIGIYLCNCPIYNFFRVLSAVLDLLHTVKHDETNGHSLETSVVNAAKWAVKRGQVLFHFTEDRQ